MFEPIPAGTEIDFVGRRSEFGALSTLLIAASIISVVVVGPNYGIDFKGGTEAIVKFTEDIESDEVTQAFEKIGVGAEQVQRYGADDSNEFLVQSPTISVVGPKFEADAGPNDISAESVYQALDDLQTVKDWVWSRSSPNRLEITFASELSVDRKKIEKKLKSMGLNDFTFKEQRGGEPHAYVVEFQGLQSMIEASLKKELGGTFGKIKRLETVGPRAGEQLRNSGIYSIVIALFWVLVYVAFRFDLRYAPGAVAALTHDILIAIGFYTVTQLEVSLPIIAAFLTIIGYSLNDTIVIFDRIRENVEEATGDALEAISNRSINETLSRTLITTITTLLAVVSIAALGGGLIRNFAIALIVGVIVGTYSSVFVATPVMLKMDEILQD
ncbi:MAG: protein translocase subunit SecF [Bradymonadaceae bacterium]